MNWLAHLYLSEPDPAFRIGNLLPDMAPPGVLAGLPEAYQAGIARHRRIDRFTDAHPVVRESVGRFAPPLRRFGGILTDIFYDHFLARDWSHYSDVPLTDFTRDFYRSVPAHRRHLPPDARRVFFYMRAGDWLASYREVDGIRDALRRLSHRFRRPVELAPATKVLEDHYDAFHNDFRRFFPDLRAHLAVAE